MNSLRVSSQLVRGLQESKIVCALKEFVQAHSMAIVVVLLVFNIVTLSFLFSANSSQHQLILAQESSTQKMADLQEKLLANNEDTAKSQVFLQEIKNSLEQLNSRSDSEDTVLGTADSTVVSETPTTFVGPVPLGIIQVSPNAAFDKTIYDTPTQGSVIETVKSGQVMLYYEKANGWYKVDSPEHIGMTGWIQQDNILEIPSSAELPK